VIAPLPLRIFEAWMQRGTMLGADAEAFQDVALTDDAGENWIASASSDREVVFRLMAAGLADGERSGGV
jgi:hypothetical protein